MKNWRTWLEVLVGIVVLGLAGSYVLAREDRIRMQATIDAQNAVIKSNQQQIQEISASLKQREAQYQQDTRDLNAKFSEASKSQAQMTALLAQLGKLPQPITITTPAPTKENPNPTPVATVPQANFQAIETYAHECEQCKLDRQKLLLDTGSRQQQMALAQKEIDALKTERDTAVRAAKGGSGVQRFLRATKWVIIGAAAGYVAGHKF